MNRITEWIKSNDYNKNDIRQIVQILEQYPYFSIAHTLFLKMVYSLSPDSFNQELVKHVLYMSERQRSLQFILERGEKQRGEKDKDMELEQKPEHSIKMAVHKSTDISDQIGVIEIPESATVDSISPVYVYESVAMEFIEDEVSTEHHEYNNRKELLIDRFIEANPSIPPITDSPIEQTDQLPQEREDDFYFSETLAKVYIKQKLYEKAILTYTKLSLKYPEKSVYFAHLIEKTKDLINKNNK